VATSGTASSHFPSTRSHAAQGGGVRARDLRSAWRSKSPKVRLVRGVLKPPKMSQKKVEKEDF
jgi:hypothetical protein